MTMKRKVQLTGTSTFTLSLPKQWAVRQGIGSGAELTIDEAADGSLVIRTTAAEERPRETAIVASQHTDSEELVRAIFSRYLAGYDIIRLVSREQAIKPWLHEAVSAVLNRTIGLEITEESEHEIVLQNFFSPEGFSIKKMIKRAHMIAYAMQRNAFSAFLKSDPELCRFVEERDSEVDKVHFLIRRILGLAIQDSSLLQKLELDARDCMDYFVVVINLEHMADTAVRMAQSYRGQERPTEGCLFTEDLERLNTASMELGKEAVDSFFSGDAAKAHGTIKKGDALKEELNALRKKIYDARGDKKAKALPLNIMMTVTSIQAIAASGIEIAKFVIDRDALKERPG